MKAILITSISASLVCGFDLSVLAKTVRRASTTPVSESVYLSPCALAVSPDGHTLFIACATANQLAFFDVARAWESGFYR